MTGHHGPMTSEPDKDEASGVPPHGTEPTGGRPLRPKHRTRRRVLKATGGLLGTGLLVGGAYGVNFAVVYGGRKQSNVGDLKFANPVHIPRLLEGRTDGAGRLFELKARAGTTELLPGKKTPTWGVNGTFLGPTLRARRGDKVRVAYDNRLPEATTLHWHGMHLPATMDGGPHQMVQPNAIWKPYWTIEQPASTLWYHPHPHEETADHVTRGIAGMFILDDEKEIEERTKLPRDYGVDDIPLIVQDRKFNDDGTMETRGASTLESFAGVGGLGVLGDTILVNGTYDPHLKVTSTLVRLRLMNASNARVYNFGFTDNREFHLVAQENGLVERPVPLRRLQLAAAERAEIVVRFEPGQKTVLRSFAPDLGIAFPTERMDGGQDTFDIIELRAAQRLSKSEPLPDRLRDTPAAIEVPGDAKVRKFRMSGTQINGKDMEMTRVDVVTAAKSVELWDVTASGDGMHTLHIHGLAFNIVRYKGKRPPAHLRGAKDTVHVPPDETVRLAVAMPRHVNADFPYMFHCHVLKHEDRGMMGQFTVVRPGTEGEAPRTVSAHH
jgi:FtsP/CotA-like multicopper oxidase with cupredoxin domain